MANRHRIITASSPQGQSTEQVHDVCDTADPVAFIRPLPTWDMEGQAWTTRDPAFEGSILSRPTGIKPQQNVLESHHGLEQRTVLESQFEEQWTMTLRGDVASKVVPSQYPNHTQQQLLERYARQNVLYIPQQTVDINTGLESTKQNAQHKSRTTKDGGRLALESKTPLGTPVLPQPRRQHLEAKSGVASGDPVTELCMGQPWSTPANGSPTDAKRRNTRPPLQARSPNRQDAGPPRAKMM